MRFVKFHIDLSREVYVNPAQVRSVGVYDTMNGRMTVIRTGNPSEEICVREDIRTVVAALSSEEDLA